MIRKTKGLLGVLVKDIPRYFPALLAKNSGYLAVCNRNERLEPAPDGSGYRCDWQWTSDLHAPKVLPFLGRWLMRRALADHPIRRMSAPPVASDHPDISFLIGHRGKARLPHLLATLESIAGQKDVAIECIVVEQDVEPLSKEHLPLWVRHIHTPPPTADMPYCRSWAFNVAARCTRGRILVLHDNDMLIPEDYASQLSYRIGQGFEVVNLKRFIFYLSEGHTDSVFRAPTRLFDEAPATIVQNLEAGGSVAITRVAYEKIGGMDESFFGWGGEDNEFWERAQTCKVWPYGYLPIVHLWHANQPGKVEQLAEGCARFFARRNVAVAERIQRLRSQSKGQTEGPRTICEQV